MYEARDEAAREKIRQMVRQGKNPEYMHNFDREISAYQDRSGNMYVIRDEVAREKIRMLVQQGKDPESLGNYDRDIRDYQDRCNERNSSYKIFPTTYNQPSPNTNNKVLTEIVLTAEQNIAQHNNNLDELNCTLEIIIKCLKTDGNPGWFITQMIDLKTKCGARMKSLEAEEKSMKYLAWRNAEEATRKLAAEKAERKRQNKRLKRSQ